jgi:hypothetical protein
VEQVREAAEFLLNGKFHGRRQSTPPIRLLLVGYSYGSIISASASASIPQVVAVASIAPPIGVRHWLFLFNGNYHLEQARKRANLPHLLVIGDEDNFTSEASFMDVVKSMRQDSTTGAVLKGADHFFRGREKDLMDILGESTRVRVPSGGARNGYLWKARWRALVVFINQHPFFPSTLGHWILGIFPQCGGDLKALAESNFPLYEVPSESMNSDQELACDPCGPGGL